MKQKPLKGIDFTGICAVFLCHDGQGNFVMNRRSINARDEHGKWDIGGGGLKFGETIEDCLTREIKEEYCTDIISHDFLGYRDVHRVHNDRPTHWIALDFLVHVDRSQVAIGDPVAMDEVAWFTLQSIPPDSDRHSQAPAFWNKYISQISAVLSRISQPT